MTSPTPDDPSSEAGAAEPSPIGNDGARIGRYEIRTLLGRGGMGSVYRAHDPVLERDVALKVMLPHIVNDPEQKQRFEREARAVARLSHPGVVTVFDLGYHTDGSPYIVMELLRGRDLLARVRVEPPLSLQEKISIVTQVLDGLGHAHKAGIVHRDIKPANIFLAEEGGARIMDFGLAYFTASGATSQSIMGTVAYMSAEQVLGERLDGRSDLFSVGTLLCELLTGQRPFAADTPAATLYRIAHDEPRIDLPAGSDQRFLPVLRRAMARKVKERFQTAAEFADALRSCTTETPSVAPAPAPSPAPAASARPVDPSGLFQLLRKIYVEEKTGQLHFAAGGRHRSLRILKGRILNGSSDTAGEHLGDVLVRYGLLGQADLERAVSVVLRERKRLGVVLSQTGLVERDTLEEAAGIHVREILFDALDRADVAFSFEELAESSLESDLVSPQSMGQVILEATRRVFNPDLVRRVLGDTSRVLTLSPDPLLRSQRITLSPTDGFVLSRIDGTLSASDVMALIPLPAEDTERSLFSLLCTGIIDYRTGIGVRRPAASVPPPGPQASAPASAAAPAPAPAPASAPAPAPAPAPTPGMPSVRSLGTAEIRAILEASSQTGRNPFEVLDLEPSTDEAEIRRAYARLARVLHPDAALDPSLDDLRPRREAAFVQLGQAYETLRSPIARRQAAERATRARGGSTPPAPQQAAASSATAPRPEPPSLARSAAEPAPGPGSIDPDAVVRSARRHFEQERYWEAIQLLEPLLEQTEGAPRVQVRMLLAQAYLKNPKWKKRAEEVVLELLRETPRHAPAHLLLAEIYRASGLVARARTAYQKVLTLQPDNDTAARGLAELLPEPEPEPESPPPGRLRGLLRRR